MKSEMPKVVAILVAYNPSYKQLVKTVSVLAPQADVLLIVDNSEQENQNLQSFFFEIPNLKYIKFSSNMGIAYAQNIGFEVAESLGAGFVFLVDQDTTVDSKLVGNLLSEFLVLKHSEPKLIAVAPLIKDERNHEYLHLLVKTIFVKRLFISKNNKPQGAFNVELLISSGTMIDMALLKITRGNRSNLFIDNVDAEWCFRVREKGFKLMVLPNMEIIHTVGDKVISVPLSKKIKFFRHTPLRSYYNFRNSVLILKDSTTDKFLKIFIILRLTRLIIQTLFISDQKLKRFFYVFLGIAHGSKGIEGKLNTETNKTVLIPQTDWDPC